MEGLASLSRSGAFPLSELHDECHRTGFESPSISLVRRGRCRAGEQRCLQSFLFMLGRCEAIGRCHATAGSGFVWSCWAVTLHIAELLGCDAHLVVS